MSLAARRPVTPDEVPVLGGATRRYVHLDHAASTAPLPEVVAAVAAFSPYYANVHRGAGFKSRLSTWALEDARGRVAAFVGADPQRQVVVFTRNTTDALNRAAARWPLGGGDVVIATEMEHHSNDLPWRRVARVEHAKVDATGRVDEDHLRDLLERHRGALKVLAVSAASNVTGIVNPVHRWAAWAHRAGARIVVDAAQLLAHQRLAACPADDPEHLDAIAFSAHKLYAPFGVGVLVAPRDVMERGEPYAVGGGTVEAVDLDHAVWSDAPHREEAGTPCVIGAVALAAAIDALAARSWEQIAQHESALAAYLGARLRQVSGLDLYGRARADDCERIGVFAFNLEGAPHGLVAAVLDHEWAIGARSGCFCAHPYVKRLLGLSTAEYREFERRVTAGDKSALPGMVRVSIGVGTSRDDVDRLALALADITAARYAAGYRLDARSGEYLAPEPEPDYREYLA